MNPNPAPLYVAAALCGLTAAMLFVLGYLDGDRKRQSTSLFFLIACIALLIAAS